MSSKNLAYSILAGLMVVSVVQHVWYFPQLPDRVATHFGADGRPNDWMSRTGSTLTLAGIQLGVPLFLAGVTSLARRLPNSMINIPHKEYWLHPDRREASLAYTGGMLAWIAVMTSVFMILIGHLTFLANKTGTGLNLVLFTTALGSYLLGVFAVAGRSVWRFRLPTADRQV